MEVWLFLCTFLLFFRSVERFLDFCQFKIALFFIYLSYNFKELCFLWMLSSLFYFICSRYTGFFLLSSSYFIERIWFCSYFSRYRTSALDEEIVGVMAEHFGVSRQSEAERLLRWGYETHTATYLILLNRYIW